MKNEAIERLLKERWSPMKQVGTNFNLDISLYRSFFGKFAIIQNSNCPAILHKINRHLWI